jgi:hypothetical protein
VNAERNLPMGGRGGGKKQCRESQCLKKSCHDETLRQPDASVCLLSHKSVSVTRIGLLLLALWFSVR